ncbi:MAG: riboflavin biosynthesis protein RibF [Clostridia bacterium]|nr:riboflavin biosynthesis protein RibF [Clostridia bacterium]
MLLFDRLEKLHFPKKTAVCLGFFDGVHLGHQAVLSAAVNNDAGLIPAVFSFLEHPQDVLTDTPVLKLTDIPRKLELLRRFQIQAAGIVPFAQVQNMSPGAFFVMLRDQMNAGMVCMGRDFRFGRDRSGDADLMQQMCAENGIRCVIVDPVERNGRKISSSAIRINIATGRMLEATKMLGHSFMLRAPVVEGQHLGRTLGFPTVNQPLPADIVQPKFGVYLSYVVFDGAAHPAVTNVGVRPSATPCPPTCESHIFNFEGDLYGKTLQLALTNFIRPEQKFEDLNALRAAVNRDMLTALSMHKALQDGGITTLC